MRSVMLLINEYDDDMMMPKLETLRPFYFGFEPNLLRISKRCCLFSSSTFVWWWNVTFKCPWRPGTCENSVFCWLRGRIVPE